MNMYFIYGCMFSGKSTKFINLIKFCNQAYIAVNHSRDTRFIKRNDNVIENNINKTDIIENNNAIEDDNVNNNTIENDTENNNAIENDNVIKNINENYGEGKIITHTGESIDCFQCSDVKVFMEYIERYNIESIFIDEIQFFDDKFIDILILLNVNIYVCGLDRDFRGEYFPASKRLLDIIPDDNKIHMKAICDCGKFATMTMLKISKPESNILVGDSSIYKPVCKSCHR